MEKIFIYLFFLISVYILFGCKFIEENKHSEHSYEYISYEETHFKHYTCGCPSPEIAELHYDFDENGNCDACNYITNFDVIKYVSILKDNGLLTGRIYATEEELIDANKSIRADIKLMGGDFTAEIKHYISLNQDGDYSKAIMFMTFANEEQATSYAELYVSSRFEDSSWKVAKSGCVVIISNFECAIEVIHLEFK